MIFENAWLQFFLNLIPREFSFIQLIVGVNKYAPSYAEIHFHHTIM